MGLLLSWDLCHHPCPKEAKRYQPWLGNDKAPLIVLAALHMAAYQAYG
jgi:hypothetical protein